jgi:glycosyltransferase involved in cell wall biosynthesis
MPCSNPEISQGLDKGVASMTGHNGRVNVLHITLSARQGGGPEHLYQLVQGLPAHVHSFIASPDEPPYIVRYQRVAGIDHIVHVPHRKVSFGALRAVISFIRDNRIHIVHSHGKGAGLYGRIAALLTGCKSVHTFHGIHIQYGFAASACYRLLETILRRATDAFICVSAGEAEVALAKGFASRQRCHIVPNGVAIPEQPAGIDEAGLFSIIHMSRFDYAKNSEMLIPVALALREHSCSDRCRFVILGTGGNEAEVRNAAVAAGVGHMFHFAGNTPAPRAFLRGELAGHGGRAGCYLSTSRWEGLPLAVLEAMSEGVPVVATNVVGNADAVRHEETGFLYDLQQPAEAAEFIARLAGSSGLRNAMGYKAFIRAKDAFSRDAMVSGTAAVYASVLQG